MKWQKVFGSYYNTYVKKQNRRPASELLQWAKDQKIPLEVSVKTKAGWQKVTDLTTIGPLATREIVVPLDLKNVEDSSVEVKLSSGFMFWEIDYAAIDFSEENDFSVETISPAIATDETGKNVLPELNKKRWHLPGATGSGQLCYARIQMFAAASKYRTDLHFTYKRILYSCKGFKRFTKNCVLKKIKKSQVDCLPTVSTCIKNSALLPCRH